ncbi:MAG: glycosyl hydrolase-related protein, partial [Planctomycetota bacterium]
HQWPEDFEPLLASPLLRELPRPAIVQWLELMPSRDWMCRSELLLPRLRELQGRDEIELRPATMSQLVAALREDDEPPPPRAYGMDDVWHGMTLGKNGDRHPRLSRRAATRALAAESRAALAGLFGRPYAQWDVYPAWELDEAWRELLAAQHHDNHECEGLCGAIGRASFERSLTLSGDVLDRTARHLAIAAAGPEGGVLVLNRSGATRDVAVRDPDVPRLLVAEAVPPFGYCLAVPGEPGLRIAEPATVEVGGDRIVLRRHRTSVTIDPRRGLVTQIAAPPFTDGLLAPGRPLGRLRMRRSGEEETFAACTCTIRRPPSAADACVRLERRAADGRSVALTVGVDPVHGAVELLIEADELPRPDPGLGPGLRLPVAPALPGLELRADTPYAVGPVRADGRHRRKYPTGDWMTSPQWFETVDRPFTALSLVDLLTGDGAGGLLVAHDGSQQMFRTDDGIELMLSAYDPWDEDAFHPRLRARLRLLPHGPLTDAQRVALAGLDEHPAGEDDGAARSAWRAGPGDGAIPRRFGALALDGAPGVAVTALHRAGPTAGDGLPDWAGHRMNEDSAGTAYPFVVRLVELDGRAAEAILTLPGPVASAARTNLMGEVGPDVAAGERTAWLDVSAAPAPAWAGGLDPADWSSVRVPMRPHEIATVMADVVPGRKRFRDLDARREVWATVHRTAEEGHGA